MKSWNQYTRQKLQVAELMVFGTAFLNFQTNRSAGLSGARLKEFSCMCKYINLMKDDNCFAYLDMAICVV
jgi:hypothetical protein